MELTQAQLQSLQTLTVSSGKTTPVSLPVGDKIIAEVVDIDAESGEITLKINNNLISAKTLLQLAALLKSGQTLEMTVAQTVGNKIILQLPVAITDSLIRQNTLREALPKQQPVTDAIIQIKALIKNKKTSPLPDKIIQFAKNLVAKLPTPAQLSTPSGVKQAIRQSGVFFENKLSNMVQTKSTTDRTIRNDLKAMMLGLKSMLTKEAKAQQLNPTTQPTSEKMVTPLSKISLGNEIKPTNQLESSKIQTLVQMQANAPKEKKYIQSEFNKRVSSVKNENITVNDELLKSKKAIDIAQQTKTEDNAENKIKDKQIHQILSSLLNSKKKLNVDNSRATSLPVIETTKTATKPASTFSAAQQYAAKEVVISNAEIALSVIKSQNVSDVTPPRINSIIDLIETLIKQVESAISRTQVHQLNATIDQESGKLAMNVEIPVNDEDNLHLVQLHIEKEPNSEDETETIVTVNLAIDLDIIGPVYAKITLVNDNTSVILWVERKSTFQLVEQSANILHTHLEGSGLKPDNIAFHHGQPPQNKFVSTHKNQNLLDVRA